MTRTKLNKLVAVCLTVIMVISFWMYMPIMKASAYPSAYPVPSLTGNQREDIVNVALSQKGYKKSGGTVYGAWYDSIKGTNYVNQAWCAMFVSWCANQAGIDQNVLTYRSYVPDMVSDFKSKGQWHDRNYTPSRGDIIIVNSSGHVGIVTGVSGRTVYTIEGNKTSLGSACGTDSYTIGSSYITGYGVPNYSAYTTPPTSNVPTWATLATQDNRTVFGIGEQVQFKMNSDNAKYYVIGIDYEGERIVTSTMEEGYDLYCYGFNFTGNYTAYVSAYNGDNHIESNVINFKVVEKVDAPTWATLTTQDNRDTFEIGEQVQFKMNSDNAKYYVIGIDYEGERIVTSPMAEGYDLYCYGFNFPGNYTAYVSAYNGDNHVESNVINFKVTHSYGEWTTVKSATCISEGQETRICSTCGEKETRSIAKTSHNYVTKVIPSTTTEQGYDLHTCSLCGNSYKDNFKELEKLLGDINADGKFNISDAVILQKWLLAVPNTKLADWKAADLCEDDRLDVFDLCMMKRMLLNS